MNRPHPTEVPLAEATLYRSQLEDAIDAVELTGKVEVIARYTGRSSSGPGIRGTAAHLRAVFLGLGSLGTTGGLSTGLFWMAHHGVAAAEGVKQVVYWPGLPFDDDH